jgi:hypothetical protein
MYLIRGNARTVAFVRDWASRYDASRLHDQNEMYSVIQSGPILRHPDDVAVKTAYNKGLWVGILPTYSFSHGHSYGVYRLHEVGLVVG